MAQDSDPEENVSQKITVPHNGIRVKTCGKSARNRLVTVGWDKPCELKCHVYPSFERMPGPVVAKADGGVGSLDK